MQPDESHSVILPYAVDIVYAQIVSATMGILHVVWVVFHFLEDFICTCTCGIVSVKISEILCNTICMYLAA